MKTEVGQDNAPPRCSANRFSATSTEPYPQVNDRCHHHRIAAKFASAHRNVFDRVNIFESGLLLDARNPPRQSKLQPLFFLHGALPAGPPRRSLSVVVACRRTNRDRRPPPPQRPR